MKDFVKQHALLVGGIGIGNLINNFNQKSFLFD